MWNSRNKEEFHIALVSNKKQDVENNTSNAYTAQHKKKGIFKNFKGPGKKVELSKIECYNYHKMGNYRSHYLKNPRNKKRKREHENFVEEAPPKKSKA